MGISIDQNETVMDAETRLAAGETGAATWAKQAGELWGGPKEPEERQAILNYMQKKAPDLLHNGKGFEEKNGQLVFESVDKLIQADRAKLAPIVSTIEKELLTGKTAKLEQYLRDSIKEGKPAQAEEFLRELNKSLKNDHVEVSVSTCFGQPGKESYQVYNASKRRTIASGSF